MLSKLVVHRSCLYASFQKRVGEINDEKKMLTSSLHQSLSDITSNFAAQAEELRDARNALSGEKKRFVIRVVKLCNPRRCTSYFLVVDRTENSVTERIGEAAQNLRYWRYITSGRPFEGPPFCVRMLGLSRCVWRLVWVGQEALQSRDPDSAKTLRFRENGVAGYSVSGLVLCNIQCCSKM